MSYSLRVSSLALAVAFVALAVTIYGEWQGLERRKDILSRLDRAVTVPPELDDLRAAVARIEGDAGASATAQEALARRMQELTIAVAEGIERVDRSERRVRTAVASAKRRLDEAGYEDPGLEAEASQLQLLNGEGGGQERMPDVQLDVGHDYEGASTIKGVSAAALARAKGYG